MTPELLTVQDVARITRLSAYTIRAAVREGQLRATKLRGRILVHPDDLATWIDQGTVRPTSELLHDMPTPTARIRRPMPPGGVRAAIRNRRNAA